MQQALFGEIHPDIAKSLSDLGRWYGAQGNIERAVGYSQRALAMRRELFGETHPDIASSLGGLGKWHGVQGDIKTALGYLEQALTMRRELFGEIHPDIALSLDGIAFWYGKQPDSERALQYSEQALAMYRTLYGDQHSSTSVAATQVARFLIRLNRRQEAYDLVSHFLLQIPPQDSSIDLLKRLESQLLSKPIRKGFRQPPKRGKSKARKKRR